MYDEPQDRFLTDPRDYQFRCWACNRLCDFEDTVPTATLDDAPHIPWDARTCHDCADLNPLEDYVEERDDPAPPHWQEPTEDDYPRDRGPWNGEGRGNK